jgi:hypothetical protein
MPIDRAQSPLHFAYLKNYTTILRNPLEISKVTVLIEFRAIIHFVTGCRYANESNTVPVGT